MRVSIIVAGSLLARCSAIGQTYTISTYAGGAPPTTPVAAAKASLGGTPSAITSDTAGNIYFSTVDQNACVFKLDQTGILTLIAGNSRKGYAGDGGPATSAQFYEPNGLVFDSAGNLYISDSGNNRIRRVSPSGPISTVAGNGTGGYSGDGGPAIQAQLSGPSGLAVDSAGDLYIADSFNFRIRKVSPAGNITTFAGNGTSGYSGDGGPATSAQLNGDYGLAVDASGNLYIAGQRNERIRKVSATGSSPRSQVTVLTATPATVARPRAPN